MINRLNLKGKFPPKLGGHPPASNPDLAINPEYIGIGATLETLNRLTSASLSCDPAGCNSALDARDRVLAELLRDPQKNS